MLDSSSGLRLMVGAVKASHDAGTERYAPAALLSLRDTNRTHDG